MIKINIFVFMLIAQSVLCDSFSEKGVFLDFMLGQEKGLIVYVVNNDEIYCAPGLNTTNNIFFSKENKFNSSALEVFLKKSLNNNIPRIYLGADEKVSYKVLYDVFALIGNVCKEKQLDIYQKISLLTYLYRDRERYNKAIKFKNTK